MPPDSNNEKLPKDAKDARVRLLDAAELLFADRGFADTSIRQLTAKAACNLAAVNYHFGSKDELYCELFRRRFRRMKQDRLTSIKRAMAEKPAPTLSGILYSFSMAFVEPFGEAEKSRRFMDLFAREMVDRRLPAGLFVEELAGPTLAALGQALRLVCPGLGETAAKQCIMSLIAQLVHAVHIKAMFEGKASLDSPAFDIPGVIEHIVKFSAAGICACRGAGSEDA